MAGLGDHPSEGIADALASADVACEQSRIVFWPQQWEEVINNHARRTTCCSPSGCVETSQKLDLVHLARDCGLIVATFATLLTGPACQPHLCFHLVWLCGSLFIPDACVHCHHFETCLSVFVAALGLSSQTHTIALHTESAITSDKKGNSIAVLVQQFAHVSSSFFLNRNKRLIAFVSNPLILSGVLRSSQAPRANFRFPSKRHTPIARSTSSSESQVLVHHKLAGYAAKSHFSAS